MHAIEFGLGPTQAMCPCGARSARTQTLQSYGAGHAGKIAKAEALVSDLPLDQRGEFALQQFAILGKRFDEKQTRLARAY